MTGNDKHIEEINIDNILNYLNDQKEHINRFLEQLVLAESPSSDPKAQEFIFNILKDKLQSLDFKTTRFPGKTTGGYLYAKPKNRKKHAPLQLLIGHCDTVWPIGTIEQMKLHTSNGKMSGPGVYDMKAGLTQIAFALQSIKALNLALSVTPVILINSDEEIGSKESENAIQKLSKIADRAYILEPPLGIDGKLKTARKGIGRFTLLIIGKAAHAGLDPGKGASAIVELSYQVQQLFAMNDPEKGITVNVGMIEGGISPNMVAPMSKAIFDVRVLTEKDAETITKKIRSLKPINPDVSVEIEGAIGRPPMEKTERNQTLWAIAKKAGLRINLELEQATAGGGSDGNTTSLHTATLDGLGTTGDGAHAIHEYIFVDKLIERTLLLILLLIAKPIKNIKNEQ
jgi:glutamate carboxypeptidase